MLEALKSHQKNSEVSEVESLPHWPDLISNHQILKNIYKLNWCFPKPVQCKAIPVIRSGKHVIVESPNGTGKTGSFVLGSLSTVSPVHQSLQVISISHTKEIKDMHFQIFSKISQSSGIEVMKTEKGKKPSSFLPHVLCGTLESCINFLRNLKKPLGQVKIIIDECDEILSQNERKNQLSTFLTRFSEKQVILFSATLSQCTKDFTEGSGLLFEEVLIEPPSHLNPNVKVLNFWLETFHEKNTFLLNCLRRIGFKMCIVFMNSKKSAATLASLTQDGYKARLFSGQLEDNEREETLKLVENGKVNVLIATDLLGRGFDCQMNDLVINYDCPLDPKDFSKANFNSFFHRCGRTGRNNRRGTVINLVTWKNEGLFAQVFERFHIPVKTLQTCELNQVSTSVENNSTDYLV
jgi:superfamily II DNA/RNA helicase